jgi:hypothetical protein
MSKEAMTLAIEFLSDHRIGGYVIEALEEALAKQEQGEPDLIECGNCHEGLADMEHVCKKCYGAGWVNNPKQEQGEPVAKMTAHRAAYFMERFKKEEKLLGPNEQAAVDFVIAMLEAQPKVEQEPVAWNGKPLTWKLVPVVPTQAMLDEMNLTGREGYDEVMGDGFSASLYGAALIAAPTQPKAEQEPVAWITKTGSVWKTKWDDADIALYAQPQQKKWIGLTEEDSDDVIKQAIQSLTNGSNTFTLSGNMVWLAIVNGVEAKLRSKNEWLA